jgi:endonuclease/exonuclease/phosphatase family metal-dependent hydrolase
MNRFLLIAALLAFISCNQQQPKPVLNVITYNIRFDNPNDGINSWPNRKDKVGSLIRFHDADIVCMQEVLHSQLVEIEEMLPNYTWVGAGRDDGEKQGEYSPILYDFKKFKAIDFGWFWLSETPEKPSLGWDAACIRICTWVKLKNLASAKEFFVFNTHFDHVGEVARQNSAKLIVTKTDELAANLPVILTGDFNGEPNSEAINTISQNFADSYHASIEPPYGPVGTWNAFDYNSPLDQRIDYIFINEHFSVLKYANITDSENQRFPSDHLPVFVKFKIN